MRKTKHSSKNCNLLIIILQQVIKPFLVWNIYFTFFLSVVDCTFYKSTIKSNCILLLCHVRVRISPQELFCKKGIFRNFAKFTGKHLYQRLFFNKVVGQACFRVNLHSIVLELPARNRRNIWSLSEQKLHGNITVQK